MSAIPNPLDALQVGDEVYFKDFDDRLFLAQVVQLGKSKGRRFKVAYGRKPHEMWLNNHGSATASGGYHFARIEILTDHRRIEIRLQDLRATAQARSERLSRAKFSEVPASDLEMINALLKQALLLLPKKDDAPTQPA